MVGVGLLSAALGVVAGVVVTRQVVRAPAGDDDRATVQYQCPMHPSIVQDHPGTCPICGMNLVEIEAPPPAAARHAAEEPTAPPVAGMAAVTIDPDRQQLIGLRTAEAVRAPISGELRTVGHVTVDETRVKRVSIKNGGFVERVYADFVGKRVRKGERLFTYYSPELLAAQEEYLAARRLGGPLLEAARRRLTLWDMPAAELRRLETTGEPSRTVTVHAPFGGTITRKEVVDGMRLEPGAMPYEIVDLSAVWVLADVYETDLRFITPGVPAVLSLRAFPGRTFDGKVGFVDPFLDATTRTARVRLAFPNPAGELRPEMFGEVTLRIAPHDGLVVPADAIIDSGTTTVVFVARGEGKFEPRRVEVGQASGATVEILGGLDAGDRVVTRANFLVDSESRLRASLGGMAAPADPPERARALPPSGADPHAGHR